MRTSWTFFATALAATASVAAYGATSGFRSDMSVSIVGAKESVKKTIVFTAAAKNNGSDDAREVVLALTTPDGLEIANIEKGTFDGCQRATVPEGHVTVRCQKSSLGNGSTATVKVHVSNPSNAAGDASVQVFSIVPDHVPANNFATVTTP